MASSSDAWSANANPKRVSQPFGVPSSSDARSGHASSKRVSQPFACSDHVPVNIGTFNLGLYQDQINSKGFPKKTLANFRRIVAKCFEEADLHFLSLCEVGGHKQGLSTQMTTPSSITDGALKQGEYNSSATQAYMSIWHEAGDSQAGRGLS